MQRASINIDRNLTGAFIYNNALEYNNNYKYVYMQVMAENKNSSQENNRFLLDRSPVFTLLCDVFDDKNNYSNFNLTELAIERKSASLLLLTSKSNHSIGPMKAGMENISIQKNTLDKIIKLYKSKIIFPQDEIKDLKDKVKNVKIDLSKPNELIKEYKEKFETMIRSDLESLSNTTNLIQGIGTISKNSVKK